LGEGIVYILKDTVKLPGLNTDLFRLYKKSFIFRFNIQKGRRGYSNQKYWFTNGRSENTKAKLDL